MKENNDCALYPGTLPLSLSDSGTNDRSNQRELCSSAEGLVVGRESSGQFLLHIQDFVRQQLAQGLRKVTRLSSQLDCQFL